jgi:hypothetical protein
MEMTLDEYLAEIDRWKQPVSDRAAALSAAERAEVDREARAWLVARIGRSLRTPRPHEPAMPSHVPESLSG